MSHTFNTDPVEYDGSENSRERITANSQLAAQHIHGHGGQRILQEVLGIARAALLKYVAQHPSLTEAEAFGKISLVLERPVWINRVEGAMVERVMAVIGGIYFPVDPDKDPGEVQHQAYSDFVFRLEPESRAIEAIETRGLYPSIT